MRQTTPQIFKRYSKACSLKENFRDMYERAYRIAIPNRNMYNNPVPGQRKNYNNYTSLGTQVVDRFVNHIQASLTPPFKRWVELKAGDSVPEEISDQLNKAYSDFTKVGFEMLDASNFNVAISESYYDLAVGTSCLLVSEGDDNAPFIFTAVPPEQVTLVEDGYGRVYMIFRKHKIEAALIKETWPTARLSAEMQRLINSNPLCDVEVLEVTYKVGKKYYYEVFNNSTQDKFVESVMSRSGWVITRLGKVPGEPYGRGPVIVALEDLQMYNKAKELMIRSAQMSTFGMYTVADSDIINPNTLVLSPGMMIPVSRNAGANGPSIAPLPGAGNLDMQQFMLADLQNDIKTIMMNDRMPPEIGAVRSATEYALRGQSRQIDVQSYFGRLQYEMVQPLWQNMLTIMYEKEVLGDIPPELITIDNMLLKVRVVSPLAKEQGIIDMQNTIQTIQTAQALAGLEAVNASYKMEDLPYILARDSGMTQDLLRTKEEREQFMAQAQQAAQMQQMAEMAGMSSAAA
ncbi:portal protein [Candidatus Odyssella acanthamoebae]|nr:portal protein [Candidatus Paracaedibacter acanthamoebae]